MKHTFDFLKQLDKNNNREWFTAHKSDYEKSHEEMQEFAEKLIGEMNKYDQIETPSAKKSLYRIYRDVRFSKDKTPYKNHWSGRMKRATKALRGGYYYHIQPGNTLVVGGFFGPNSEDLLHIRKHLAQEADPLRKVMASKKFKDTFGEMFGEQLKTAPKGFDKEHPDLDLLRYKQFMVKHSFTDKEVLDPKFHVTMAKVYREMRSFFDYMSDILTTDLNGRPLI